MLKDYAKIKAKVEFTENKQRILEEIILNQHEKLAALTFNENMEQSTQSSCNQEKFPKKINDSNSRSNKIKEEDTSCSSDKSDLDSDSDPESDDGNESVCSDESGSSKVVPSENNGDESEKEKKSSDSEQIFQLPAKIFLRLFNFAEDNMFYDFGPNIRYISVNLKEEDWIRSDFTVQFSPNAERFKYACSNWGCKVKSEVFAFQSGPWYSTLHLYKAVSLVDDDEASIFNDKSTVVCLISSNGKILKPKESSCSNSHKFELDLEEFIVKKDGDPDQRLFLAIKVANNG